MLKTGLAKDGISIHQFSSEIPLKRNQKGGIFPLISLKVICILEICTYVCTGLFTNYVY